MKNSKIITSIFLLVFISFVSTAFAQKNTKKLIDKDPALIKAMQEQSDNKGLVNYNVMKDIFQKPQTQQVKFKVQVEQEQNVMIEVFNDEGELIQVIYNDLLKEKQAMPVTIDGENWQKEASYYIRVTTEDFIETHEVVFSDSK